MWFGVTLVGLTLFIVVLAFGLARMGDDGPDLSGVDDPIKKEDLE